MTHETTKTASERVAFLRGLRMNKSKMPSLSDKLRNSTEAMANGCTAHPELWNIHANNCLAAAEKIEQLLGALEAIESDICLAGGTLTK